MQHYIFGRTLQGEHVRCCFGDRAGRGGSKICEEGSASTGGHMGTPSASRDKGSARGIPVGREKR